MLRSATSVSMVSFVRWVGLMQVGSAMQKVYKNCRVTICCFLAMASNFHDCLTSIKDASFILFSNSSDFRFDNREDSNSVLKFSNEGSWIEQSQVVVSFVPCVLENAWLNDHRDFGSSLGFSSLLLISVPVFGRLSFSFFFPTVSVSIRLGNQHTKNLFLISAI